MKPLVHHLLSIPLALSGTAMVFTAIYYLNEAKGPPAIHPDRDAVMLQIPVEPEKKREHPKPSEQRRPRQKKASRSLNAPIPNIASRISAADFNLAGYALEGSARGAIEHDAPASNSLVMTEDCVDQPVQATQRTAPQYPDRARSRGITGFVTVKMLIGKDGTLQRVEVADAQPEGVFDGVVLAAVRTWAFKPAVYNGQPVASWAKQTLRFELK